MQGKRTIADFRKHIEEYLKENFAEQFCLGVFYMERSGWLRVEAVSLQSKKKITVWYDKKSGECRDSRLKEKVSDYVLARVESLKKLWQQSFYEINIVYQLGRPADKWDASADIFENMDKQRAVLVVRFYIREESREEKREAQKIRKVLEALQSCLPIIEVSFRYLSENNWKEGINQSKSKEVYDIKITDCEAFYYAMILKTQVLPETKEIEEAMKRWQM